VSERASRRERAAWGSRHPFFHIFERPSLPVLHPALILHPAVMARAIIVDLNPTDA
jgi:hypothetical protein